ncbi:MAG: SLBB domain-containing protein [Candidatus Schekmanbacteria bacterium]|nr:SLBB domain-containing protein [Candidatus Schekmanbacteria bacterium]
MTTKIIDAVCAAGVVGAGGAGFPAHIKLQAKVDLIIANGCECEPLLCTDQYLMENQADAVIKGLSLALQTTGADKGIIALKGKYSASYQALQKAAKGIKAIEFSLLPNYYPMGDEQILTWQVSGRLVPLGGIPTQAGVLVQNVTTLSQIAAAIDGLPVTHRMVAVLGEVAEPKVLKVPVGTPVSQVIAWTGGFLREDVAIITGGPMMGQLTVDPDTPITKTTNALLVLPKEHHLILNKRKNLLHMQRHSQSYCHACSGCQILCPRQGLGHPIRPQRSMRSAGYPFTTLPSPLHNITACSQCGVCGFYACPMGLNPAIIHKDLQKYPKDHKIMIIPTSRSQNRSLPLGIPTVRLIQRLGLGRYNQHPALDNNRYQPQWVRLPLKQHVGDASIPVVSEGAKVKAGDLLAKIPAGKLGARLHASINGKVKKITEREIIITMDN